MPLWDTFMVEKDLYETAREAVSPKFFHKAIPPKLTLNALWANVSPLSPVPQLVRHSNRGLNLSKSIHCCCTRGKLGGVSWLPWFRVRRCPAWGTKPDYHLQPFIPCFFFRTEVKTKYSLRLNGGSFQLSKAKTELCSFSNTFISLDSESRSDMIFRDWCKEDRGDLA